MYYYNSVNRSGWMNCIQYKWKTYQSLFFLSGILRYINTCYSILFLHFSIIIALRKEKKNIKEKIIQLKISRKENIVHLTFFFKFFNVFYLYFYWISFIFFFLNLGFKLNAIINMTFATIQLCSVYFVIEKHSCAQKQKKLFQRDFPLVPV